MSDRFERMNAAVRRGSLQVVSAAVVVAIMFVFFFWNDLRTSWLQDRGRFAWLVGIVAVALGLGVFGARRQSRYSYTERGIEHRGRAEVVIAWSDVTRLETRGSGFRLHCGESRHFDVDLQFVADPRLVRDGITSLVPEAALPALPA